MIKIQFLDNNKIVSEIIVEGETSVVNYGYTHDIIDTEDINRITKNNRIGIKDFDSIKKLSTKYTYFEERQLLKPIIMEKLETLDNISRKKWLAKFYSDIIWNGNEQRNETLLIKELTKLQSFSPFIFDEAVRDCKVKKYFISPNIHNHKYGLDDVNTPEGGGIIAQSSSEEKSIEIAFKVYGINKFFIR